MEKKIKKKRMTKQEYSIRLGNAWAKIPGITKVFKLLISNWNTTRYTADTFAFFNLSQQKEGGILGRTYTLIENVYDAPFLSIKDSFVTTPQRMENAIMYVVTKTKFTDYSVSYGRYNFNFKSLTSEFIQDLINYILSCSYTRMNYSWVEPLQNLILDREDDKLKKIASPKRKRSRLVSQPLSKEAIPDFDMPEDMDEPKGIKLHSKPMTISPKNIKDYEDYLKKKESILNRPRFDIKRVYGNKTPSIPKTITGDPEKYVKPTALQAATTTGTVIVESPTTNPYTVDYIKATGLSWYEVKESDLKIEVSDIKSTPEQEEDHITWFNEESPKQHANE